RSPRRAWLAALRACSLAALRACSLTALRACSLTALCACCLTPAAASAASASAALQADLSRQLQIAGSRSGAYVYDLTAHQALFTERAETLRPPASVEKLYTASTALELMGPTARLSTNVLGSGRLAAGGVWEGNLYLRGGGDPTFGTSSFIHSHYGGQGASVSALVTQLVGVDGIHHIVGNVEGDETYFDSLRGEPSSDFGPDPFLEGTLSGLAFNRGGVGSERGPHAPAAYAAHELLGALKGAGVTIQGSSGAAPTPAGATQLAQVQSPTLNGLLALTLPPSDNFFAETLVKDLGARYGGAGTTAAGAAVVSATIAKLFGFSPHVVDGSGLSASDLTSPYEVADLLVELAPTTVGAVLRGDLAVAGSTGTLSERMRETGAAGRCQGKTGTLTGVSNLVGYCQARDGHLLAFALFTDGISTSYAHTIQDHMTISIADF
ncbi:MAG TPA: D-alanyl-D-alanine carboxypeptidase/D-alanyl-D-alanine-endopeptidase, partial [Solirubrobacteraceae bacterium]|nr:D-alanyl-D-alanine carboxypeptidase/D-alanyl-D-alanine-endopeptidase [Solirubrobacteraceae bacterium]